MMNFGDAPQWAAANKDALASVLENEMADKSARLAAQLLLTLGEFASAGCRPKRAVISLMNGIGSRFGNGV